VDDFLGMFSHPSLRQLRKIFVPVFFSNLGTAEKREILLPDFFLPWEYSEEIFFYRFFFSPPKILNSIKFNSSREKHF